MKSGVITHISNEADYKSIQIGGAGFEGIVLNLNADTTFISADGKEIALTDLSIGMNVEAEHSIAMKESLPPQTSTYQITVLDTASQSETQTQETLGTAGTIENVNTDAGLISQIEIKGTSLTETSPEHVVLNITEDSVLVNQKGENVKPDQLTKGAKVIGFYSPVLTRSLPPIGTAWKVVLEVSEAVQIPKN